MLLIGDESEAARLPQHISEAVVNNSIQPFSIMIIAQVHQSNASDI